MSSPFLPSQDDSGQPGTAARFRSTRWSVVLAARGADANESRRALAALCEAYWSPLYAYVRRKGHNASDAQDLTQEFFATLLDKYYLQDVDRQRGKFRPFLLTAFQRFLAKQVRRAHAQKRGGGTLPISLDYQHAEHRYLLEPSHASTPDRVFERRWALTLLELVFRRVREEYEAAARRPSLSSSRSFWAAAGPPSRTGSWPSVWR
jgi:DNA-directed RNA polymerase specialized sigma24 family protein